MNELDLVRESDVNQRNLDVVLDHLRLYQKNMHSFEMRSQGAEVMERLIVAFAEKSRVSGIVPALEKKP